MNIFWVYLFGWEEHIDSESTMNSISNMNDSEAIILLFLANVHISDQKEDNSPKNYMNLQYIWTREVLVSIEVSHILQVFKDEVLTEEEKSRGANKSG